MSRVWLTFININPKCHRFLKSLFDKAKKRQTEDISQKNDQTFDLKHEEKTSFKTFHQCLPIFLKIYKNVRIFLFLLNKSAE